MTMLDICKWKCADSKRWQAIVSVARLLCWVAFKRWFGGNGWPAHLPSGVKELLGSIQTLIWRQSAASDAGFFLTRCGRPLTPVDAAYTITGLSRRSLRALVEAAYCRQAPLGRGVS